MPMFTINPAYFNLAEIGAGALGLLAGLYGRSRKEINQTRQNHLSEKHRKENDQRSSDDYALLKKESELQKKEADQLRKDSYDQLAKDNEQLKKSYDQVVKDNEQLKKQGV
jgi:hypothetical protein